MIYEIIAFFLAAISSLSLVIFMTMCWARFWPRVPSKDTEKLKGDQFINHKFDYLITNPPFGVKWGKVQKEVTEEHQLLGHGGRYGAGLPSVSDGSFLFLMNLMSAFQAIQEHAGVLLQLRMMKLHDINWGFYFRLQGS